MMTMAERVGIGNQALPGDLEIPANATALVLFAHGSGSTRLSSRNRQVASTLHRHCMGTLLFDLLTDIEAQDRAKVFDIDLLGERVDQALDYVSHRADLAGLRTGLFGASTGAAAALKAAATRPRAVAAIVSRGGRPDLAAPWLPRILAPTLMIVGGADNEVLDLNRRAMRLLKCNKRLEVVPGATHLFEEPGALGTVAELAADWFDTHLHVGCRA